jgi:hypothetical protein
VNTRLPLGTANQVLRVNSGETAPEWATTADQTPLTTKGDLFGFDTADARIPIGTNGQVLTADSAQSLGLKWAAPAGGGALTKITAGTFTTQSSITVADCFSSTYRTYYVTWYATSSVNIADLQLQFTYAGPNTQTSDYYGSGFQYDRGNNLSTWGFSATSETTIYPQLGTNAADASFGNIYFNNVGNSSQNAAYFGTAYGRDSQGTANYSGYNDIARTYTGFILKVDTGTITGRYQVFGLEN